MGDEEPNQQKERSVMILSMQAVFEREWMQSRAILYARWAHMIYRRYEYSKAE